MSDMKTDFIPSLHGFSFVNCFPGYPLPPLISTLPGISKILSTSQMNHGLCGGICFATHDFFLAKKTIALDTTVPKPGTPLYRYLYQRQLDTYGSCWKFVAKFAQWTVLPDSTVQSLTYKELQKVTAQLDKGQAVILGLVYVSIADTLAIWFNHQVLAYDYSQEQKILKVKIYDPNFPCQNDVFIEIKRAFNGLQCKQKVFSTGKEIPIRGFFVMPYAPVSPPII